VQSGEHFWSIAEQVVEQRGADANADVGADAEADVESYWRALVAANRDRLVDPDDTDLLHPGQVLVLP
jgi:nucleoid-associated protein YgaU